jgi:hypothetical protein
MEAWKKSYTVPLKWDMNLFSSTLSTIGKSSKQDTNS